MRLYVETNFVITASNPFDPRHLHCQQLLDLAEGGRIELLIPKISELESLHVLDNLKKMYVANFNSAKDLVRNCRRAGLEAFGKIDLDALDRQFSEFIEGWTPREILSRLQSTATFFDPSDRYSVMESRLTAALTTGNPSNPYRMADMDRRILAVVLDHDDHCQSGDKRLFCTADDELVKVAEIALEILKVDLSITDDFSNALGWARGGVSL